MPETSTVRVITSPLDCDTSSGHPVLRLGVTFALLIDGAVSLGSLSAFKDWPGLIADAALTRFIVQFSGNVVTVSSRVTNSVSEADLFPGGGPQQARVERAFALAPNAREMWAALCPLGTTVAARKTLDEKDIPNLRQTYSMAELHSKVTDTLGAAATQSTVAATSPKRSTVSVAPLAGPAVDAFRKFHGVEDLRPMPPGSRVWDFHERLALAGQYPALMKAIGLSVELRVHLTMDEANAVRALADKRIRIEPKWPQTDRAPSQMVNPYTAFLLEPGLNTSELRFLPAGDPAGKVDSGDHDRGFLRLGTPRFSTSLLDVVAAVHQVDLLTTKAAAAAPGAPAGAPQLAVTVASGNEGFADPGLPALRSNGITVFRSDRWDTAVAPRLTRASQLEAKPADKQRDETLFADDLVRGYAVDVQEVGKGWQPLCLRHVRYTIGHQSFPASGDPPTIEEGFVALTAGHSADQTRLKVHESLFSWDGWSLAAPAPACLRGNEASCSQAGEKRTNVITADHAVVCKTLPKLRFGARYRLRARCVDVGGRCLDIDGDGPNSASRHFAAANASMGPAVSNVAMTGDVKYERAQVPRAPGLYAVNDVPVATSDSPQARDAATIWFRSGSDTRVEYFLAPPAVSLDAAICHGSFDPCDEKKFNDEITRVMDDADARQWSKVFGENRLPYFRDPIVTGVRFRGLPTRDGKNNGTRILAFGSPKTTKVVLHHARERLKGEFHDIPEGTPSELHLYLRRGADVAILVSPCLSKAGVEMLSAWSCVVAADRDKVKEAAMAGLNELLCPPRVVHAIHAVSDPDSPTVPQVTASRQPYAARADFAGTIEFDPGQAGTLEWEGTWEEVVDDPNEREPRRVPKVMGRTVQQHLPSNADKPVKIDTFHNFRDTSARSVTYEPRIASRYKEFFPGAASVRGPIAEVPVKASAPPAPPRVVSVLPTFGWEKPHHRSGFSVRLYLDRPWFTSGPGELLAVLLPPPSTPAAPTKIESVVSKRWYSQWGRDPFWPDGPVSADIPLVLTPKEFLLKATTAAAPKDLRVATTAGVTEPVDVALYDVTPERNYDAERRLWFVDIALDVGQGHGNRVYNPFLRLSLARFQPIALHPPEDAVDFRLSAATTADIVQLANDRVARLERTGDTIKIFLDGVFPRNAQTAMKVVASCQTQEPDSPPELGWHDLEPVEERELKWRATDDGGWFIPEPPWTLPERGGRRTRIVLTEYECYARGDGKDGVGRRVVYFDILSV